MRLVMIYKSHWGDFDTGIREGLFTQKSPRNPPKKIPKNPKNPEKN